MYVGLLTARFPGEMTFEQIARWSADAGFDALEVHTRHLAPQTVLADGGAAVRKVLEETGLRISSLAHYANFNRNNTPEAYADDMGKVLAAAEVLGVEVVCTLAGFADGDKSKTDTIREVLPGIFGPLADDAARRGLKIAFENWFATNLQGVDTFRALVEALPQANVGFNFDPSHLYWQRCDYLAAVAEFSGRIFHTHAKDTAVYPDKLAAVGVLAGGWWRYCIPGFGEIDWGRYILALRENGYDGVLSIEHEDRAFDAESGFRAGLKYLSQFV
jgi:sugar phosphate isomerase/epimerase